MAQGDHDEDQTIAGTREGQSEDDYTAMRPLDLLHVRRGQFIEECSQVDSVLGLVLYVYFGVAMERRDQFFRLLSNLGTQQRIESFAAILPKASFPGLLQALRELNARRNVIAHGTLFPEWEDGDLENTLRWHHTMYKRTGHRREYIDASTLLSKTQEAMFVGRLLFLMADYIANEGSTEGIAEVDWKSVMDEKVDPEGVITVSQALLDKIPTEGGEPDEEEAPAEASEAGVEL